MDAGQIAQIQQAQESWAHAQKACRPDFAAAIASLQAGAFEAAQMVATKKAGAGLA